MNYENNEELAKAKILELVKNGSAYEDYSFSDEEILKKVIETAKEHQNEDNFEVWLMCTLKESCFFGEEFGYEYAWKEDISMELEDCIEYYENNGKNWEKAIEQIEEEYGYDECNEEEFYFTNAEMKLVTNYIKSKI